MIQTRKWIRRICLNNWGGISHQVFELNQYVNLFSGKSGSGKSTVLDALQVVLYGSTSPNFLNKAADDNISRRSVMSYLRGEQKDGTANRAGKDFTSLIALELEDTANDRVISFGMAFEVRKNDVKPDRPFYFSHAGAMPEDEYLFLGVPYTVKQIKELQEARADDKNNRGKEYNRTYPSRESYVNVLYNQIFGNIDDARFITMQKSAIALRMEEGTGKFIRDYMFPKNPNDALGKLSDQLGAYREIRDKINDLKKRIDLLTVVSDVNKEKTNLDFLEYRTNLSIRYLSILETEELKTSLEVEKEAQIKKEALLESKKAEAKKSLDETTKCLIERKTELKGFDIEGLKTQLESRKKVTELQNEKRIQWNSTLKALKEWEEDEYISDYISNETISEIHDLIPGKVTEKQLKQIKQGLNETQEELNEILSDRREKKIELKKDWEEKNAIVEDMKNNRKHYPDELKRAKQILSEKLSIRYQKKISVYILADLFDVTDETWKNAIEGRLGRMKRALVTEPQYALTAAEELEKLKSFESIDLLNTRAVTASHPFAEANTIYEAVETDIPYVDDILKRFLGRVKKCYSAKDLDQVTDGVTPGCYSYSNFCFRHLRKKDYTTGACIGRKVSKEKLAQYENELLEAKNLYDEVLKEINGLERAGKLEHLDRELSFYMDLASAKKEWEKSVQEERHLEEEIRRLETADYQKLVEEVKQLEKNKEELETKQENLEKELNQLFSEKGKLDEKVNEQKDKLENLQAGYASDPFLEDQIKNERKEKGHVRLINEKRRLLNDLTAKKEKAQSDLDGARMEFQKQYPTAPLKGKAQDTESYLLLLDEYKKNYEPDYQKDFDEKCREVHKSLRDNVIASIHGEIREALRHRDEINRLLREVQFSDSLYQIEVTQARDENSLYWDMLMAEELDTKNTDPDGFDGQMSLGEDLFFTKYGDLVESLMEKFTPVFATDDESATKKKKENLEKYADYRTYLSFGMYEMSTDAKTGKIRKNYVDDMAGRDSGGEGQNPKYVALLAGFAMLYKQAANRDSKIRLVLLDEAFSKMDQERSAVCLQYARNMNLQMILCVPDERLQSLVPNVDSVYGFRRYRNQISVMHIDKGHFMELMENGENSNTFDGEDDE